MSRFKTKATLVKLPAKLDYCLFLIKEELKSRAFFRHLHQAGMEDIYLQPHLDSVIMETVGLRDGTDATAEFYFEVMERRSRKIHADNDSIVSQALKVYMELVAEKRRRKRKAQKEKAVRP